MVDVIEVIVRRLFDIIKAVRFILIANAVAHCPCNRLITAGLSMEIRLVMANNRPNPQKVVTR